MSLTAWEKRERREQRSFDRLVGNLPPLPRKSTKADRFENYLRALVERNPGKLSYERHETGTSVTVISFSIVRHVGPFNDYLHVMFTTGERGGSYAGGTRHSFTGPGKKVPTERDARVWTQIMAGE